MLLVRDIYHCKPGKVRPMVEKLRKMVELTARHDLGPMRILTDVSGERFWTVVSEFEVESMEDFMSMDKLDPEAMKEFEAAMKGYHEFVDHGRREIFTIER